MKIVFILLFFSTLYGEVLPLCTLEFDNGLRIEKLPQANTLKTKQKGLSNLDDIGVGMIFTWDKPKELSFWMKDTKIALSIGFFDDKGELFQIEDMEAYSLDKHYSAKEAKTALELK
ncbi:MAG: DUF192 domain-containing protein, partial [Campylobacteraceae bacterium]|nr:DUF192 domain-containing protein [Campylobacteraceae bacterium]